MAFLGCTYWWYCTVYTRHECVIVGIYLNKNQRQVPSLEHKFCPLPDTTTLMLRGGPGTERKKSMLYTMLNACTVTKKNAHYSECTHCYEKEWTLCWMHTLFLPVLWQTDETFNTFLQTGPKRRQFLIYSCCTEYTSVADLS